MSSDEVAICIPAFNAANFIRAALDSALAQTHPSVRILVSVDRGGDDTAAVCRSYGDPRIEVVEQSDRLGWVGNVNALLDRVTSPYFCFLFHDDTMSPTYVERLLAALVAEPQAVAASATIRYYGDLEFMERHRPVRGTIYERLRSIIAEPDSFHSLKALHRSAPLSTGIRLPDNPYGGFQADIPIMMLMAAHGDYLAVDEILYHKKVWGGSVTGGWRNRSRQTMIAATAAAGAARIRIIDAMPLTPREKRMLAELAIIPRNPKLTEATPEHFPGNLRRYEHATFAMLVGELLGWNLGPQDVPNDTATDNIRRRLLGLQTREIVAQALHHGEAELAWHHARMAVRNEPDTPESHALLARSLLAVEPQGRHALALRAREHAETAIRIGPGPKEHFDLLESAERRIAEATARPSLLRRIAGRLRRMAGRAA